MRRLLDAEAPRPAGPVRMVLAPHAGYIYSGKVAATSFRHLARDFERVVILAANHNGEARYAGVSVDRSTHYAMPGFEVRVAPEAENLLSDPLFVDVPAAHASHVVEAELPFLHAIAEKEFSILPLIVGRLDDRQVQSLVTRLDGLADGKTVFVVSVDLSHFYPFDQAVALDRSCLDALGQARMDAVAQCTTDGTQVLLTMAELAMRRGWMPRLLTYANSADASGDRSRVVGYGAMIYEASFEFSVREKNELLRLARAAVDSRVREGRPAEVSPDLVRRLPRLAVPRAAFVTLKKDGRLRGCMGSFQPSQPLVDEVRDRAVMAATGDPRFPPVTVDEIDALEVSVSVLEMPRPVREPMGRALLARLGKERPGLILDVGRRRSTFLPTVWEQLPEPTTFLAHLCQKQGSPEGCYRDPGARLLAYQTQHFSE